MMKKIFGFMLLCLCLGFAQGSFAEKFSADMITTANGKTMTGKYYFSGNKFRTDTTVEGMKSSTIVLLDKSIVYTLMHNQKMYMQMPIKKADPSALSASHNRYKSSRQFIKNEVVNGIAAKKYKAVSSENSELVYIWMTQDDKWPVKIEVPSAKTVMQYKNINSNFPESVFIVPADYKTFSVPNFSNFLPR